MEDIRTANSKLREWGNEEYERAEELEKDRDYYQDLSEKYESEIADLKAAAQKAGETQLANEANEVKLKADYDVSLITITKLQEEVIEAKKVQHQNNRTYFK